MMADSAPLGPSAPPSPGPSKGASLLCGFAPLPGKPLSLQSDQGLSPHPSWLLGPNPTLLITRAAVRGWTQLSSALAAGLALLGSSCSTRNFHRAPS